MNDNVKWDEVSDAFTLSVDRLNARLDEVEREVNDVIDSLEKLPETFDVKGNLVEMDEIIEKVRKISAMIY
jgi:tetrahydromethanopterin S-methyltransferase subunit B